MSKRLLFAVAHAKRTAREPQSPVLAILVLRNGHLAGKVVIHPANKDVCAATTVWNSRATVYHNAGIAIEDIVRTDQTFRDEGLEDVECPS